jgi:Tol biopolymer transport system component
MMPNHWTNRFAILAVTLTCALPLSASFAQSPQSSADPPAEDIVDHDPQAAVAREAELLTEVRQLTFAGRRAGEGYFSHDESQMVFQSEREPGNPFFQIYLMDLETGDLERVSPGFGKTTCAWIHPDGQRVLFASTHEDEAAREKQKKEIEARAEGQQRRYSWDYDEHFDLYEYDRRSGDYKNLSRTRGYDAEGSWSPDGSLIAFASNRRAYVEPLNDALRKKFELDPAVMMEIYLMREDGSEVRQLTDVVGYDGGPFFSPDGQRICWRRFAENGATAEIFSMRIDGSEPRQLTRLNTMSWAPFYHPSGDYLIFTTNRHGFGNFELYLVDAEANSEPVRVTYTKGFDGLPVFTPDGNRLSWTSNRTSSGRSQIFLADWNDAHARELLGMDAAPQLADSPPARRDATDATAAARLAAAQAAEEAVATFAAEDIRRHVAYLCRDELAGRRTGTEGETLATAYVAAYFESLGLEPAGDQGSWFQNFDFTAGVDLGKGNSLSSGDEVYPVDTDWRPVSFSSNGRVAASPVVFAGYGIVAPEAGEQEAYDSFVHLDVTDKWVLVLRYLPEAIRPERRQHLSRYASLRYKVMLARDRGARGVIVVSGPTSQVKEQLVPLQLDGTLSGSSLPVISVTDALASRWLAKADKDLKKLQDELDRGEMMMGFEISDVQLRAQVSIRKVKRRGRNVLARLPAATEEHPLQEVLIGAHVDHLGAGSSSSSLARDEDKDAIHYGADDNASGVAALLEIAEYLSDRQREGKFKPQRSILFAAWSGEELGLLGASHFAKQLEATPTAHAAHAAVHHAHTHAAEEPSVNPEHTPEGSRPDASSGPADHPHANAHGDASKPTTAASESLYPSIAACLNMDMVGRLEKNLILQGVGSSSIWSSEIERRNVPIGLPITLQEDSYLPTDASVFYLRGVPILSAFTGSHSDYHTPRDTPDKLNYDGAARVARFMGLVTRSMALRDDPPDYVSQKAPQEGQRRANLRAYLGTIPDYTEEIAGVKLSGVAKDGPASQAGLQSGDVIVELAGRKIENIYDYTYAIEALKIGEEVQITILRDGQRLTREIVPGSRE